MNTRLLGLVALGAAAMACHNDGAGNTSAAIGTKLQSCNIVGEGKVNPYVGDSTLAQCRAECLADATCDELAQFYCRNTASARVADCRRGCTTPDCANGQGSYLLSQKCDGVRDCSDGSDENDCPVMMEQPKYCQSNGARIQPGWRCNGKADCPDGTDESNCPPAEAMFTCERKLGNLVQQVPQSAVCDLKLDCNDGSDESTAQGCAPLNCAP